LKGERVSIFALLVLILFIGGCETAKGIKKDVENTWNNAKHIDEDFKENWW